MYSIMVGCEVDGSNNISSSNNDNIVNRTTPSYPPHAFLFSLTENFPQCMINRSPATPICLMLKIHPSLPPPSKQNKNNAIERTRESILWVTTWTDSNFTELTEQKYMQAKRANRQQPEAILCEWHSFWEWVRADPLLHPSRHAGSQPQRVGMREGYKCMSMDLAVQTGLAFTRSVCLSQRLALLLLCICGGTHVRLLHLLQGVPLMGMLWEEEGLGSDTIFTTTGHTQTSKYRHG